MKDDETFGQIENRLRNEAERLFQSTRRPSAVAALLAEHRRRERLRWVIRAAGGAGTVALVISAAWTLWGLRPARPEAPRTSRHIVDTNAIPATRSAAPVTDRGPALERHGDSAHMMSVLPQTRPADNDVSGGNTFTDGVPVLFAIPDGDGQRVIAAGIYIPERVEQIDLIDFSPVVRRAVRTVLRMDETSDFQDPF